jgi:hypothetical protein
MSSLAVDEFPVVRFAAGVMQEQVHHGESNIDYLGGTVVNGVRSRRENVVYMTENSKQDYKFVYSKQGTKTRDYFSGGEPVCYRLSDPKTVEQKNTDNRKINIYRKSLDTVVGIKFVDIFSGKFLIRISNAQGQTVFRT